MQIWLNEPPRSINKDNFCLLVTQVTLPDESNETAVTVTTNLGFNKINLNHMAGVVVTY